MPFAVVRADCSDLHVSFTVIAWIRSGAFLVLALQYERRSKLPAFDLERAIAAGEIRPYYQPVINLKTGQLAGCEVLCRWIKKSGEMVMPGAFTPTCSAKHVPGFVNNYDALKDKGVDAVACVSVNDAFVMGAWGKDQKADGKVHMFADGNGDFTRALGLGFDASKFGMGKRSQRYSMVVDNGVVKSLNVEQPGAFEVSSAEHMLGQL